MPAKKDDWFQSDDKQNLAEQASSLDLEHNSVIDHNRNRIMMGHDLRNLPSIVRFTKQLFFTKDEPFSVSVNHHGRRWAAEGSTLTKYFHLVHAMTEPYSRDYHYAPSLKVFYDVFTRHDIRFCVLKGPNLPFGDGRIGAEVFNDFVKTLREEGARVNITKKMNDWQNAIDNNVKNTNQYVMELFEHYEQLTVIDLNLGYKAACIDPKQLQTIEQQLTRRGLYDKRCLYGDAVVDHDLVETQSHFDVTAQVGDRKRLFANMRSKPSLFGHQVGYVWRIDWSRVGGHHLNVVFFFNGANVHDDVLLGDLMGRYWVENITQGRGLYRNRNGTRNHDHDKYCESWGIGKVNSDDTVKCENLIRSLSHRAKRNQYLYVKTTPKCKQFGMGHMPGKMAGGLRAREEDSGNAG